MVAHRDDENRKPSPALDRCVPFLHGWISLLVDIVMATNRVGDYIAETLESVLSQSYTDWRLIVVDDGTPDPAAVPRAIAGIPRTTVVRHAPRGLPASRNSGIAAGDAPLIALLDDDDVWEPEKLEAQVALLSGGREAVASFTGGRYIDEYGCEFGEAWPGPTVPSCRYISGEIPAPRIVTLMVRRSAHEAIGGFNESYSLSEDNEYILRLAIHGEMLGAPQPLVSYRRHARNMSTAGSLEGRTAGRRLLSERLYAHRDNPEISSLLRTNLSRFESASSEECVRAFAHALRRRDVRRVIGEIGWASKAPGRTAIALLRALTRTLA